MKLSNLIFSYIQSYLKNNLNYHLHPNMFLTPDDAHQYQHGQHSINGKDHLFAQAVSKCTIIHSRHPLFLV